jgi:outer membrane receptor protein involved in Fe transport
VTQSGGNTLHGGAFEFNRGRGTSAKQYFAGALARPPYQRNEYGANFSGPIILPHLYDGRDKSFFFFAYEGFHLTQSALVSSQQPTLAFRNGDFSSLLPTTVIRDPQTGLPFTGNIIPQGRFNAVDQQLQNQLIPTPTAAGTGTNTVELVPYFNNVNRYSLRVDHKISEKNQLRGTFLSAFYGPNPQVGTSSKAGGMAGIGEHNTLVLLGLTHTFSPTLLLDSYASYTHLTTYRTPQNVGVNFAGIIPGLPAQQIEGAPQISITNITSISEAGSKDLEQQIQGYATLTKVLSRHTIKTGVSFLYSNHWNIAAITPQRGSYSFTNKYTGYAYADFLLGLPTSTQVSYPGALAYRNITDELGMFVQDDFKLTPKLTLNAGIRYDLQIFPDNIYHAQSSFVPSLGKVVVFGSSYPPQTQAAFLPLTVLSTAVGLPASLHNLFRQR